MTIPHPPETTPAMAEIKWGTCTRCGYIRPVKSGRCGLCDQMTEGMSQVMKAMQVDR